MAHNRLDNEFRDKLNQREIAPSPAAWDRLDAMLSVAEEKKSPKKLSWIYIAAALIGILLMATVFTQKGKLVSTGAPEVVHQKQNLPERGVSGEGKELVPTNIMESAVAGQNRHSQTEPSTTFANPTARNKVQNEIAHANLTHDKNSSTQQQAATKINTQDVNVDELLASASLPKNNTNAVVKVDANSLLSQVDGELELSFREKVIKSAGKNFQNVKVALANRNLE